MIRQLTIALVLAALVCLTACGGESAPTATLTVAPAETPVSAASAGNYSFSFNVTGDHEAAVTGGVISHRYTPPNEADERDAIRTVFMDGWVGSAYPRYGVALTVIGDPQVGTHTLEDAFFAPYGFEFFQHEAMGSPAIYYNRLVEGTITITEVDGLTVSGSYEFTNEGTVTDSSTNQQTAQTVTVTGTFENIPLEASE